MSSTNDDDPICGHKTLRRDDGTLYHEPLRRSEADALWAHVEREKARRETLMPDEQSAIKLMFDSYTRLRDFGWNDAIYCPKDGSLFLAIEPGSTGKHVCTYQGEWPDGRWWIDDCPSRPVLWKPQESPK